MKCKLIGAGALRQSQGFLDARASILPNEPHAQKPGVIMQRRHILLGLTSAALASPAIAQGAWPNRPLRMIVPFTPGAATDAMARLAATKLTDALGVTVVVENRAGANGAVGSQAVLQAAADGYTLLGSASIHPMARYVMKNAPYDPVQDFVAVARTARGPLVLVMNPRLPQTTIPESLPNGLSRHPPLGRRGIWAVLNSIG